MSSLQTTPSSGSNDVPPLLITMDELQRTIGCGKTTAFALVADGKVETVQIGRRRMAVFESVKDYVQQLRDQARSATAAKAPARA